jgi:hypothetical protein
VKQPSQRAFRGLLMIRRSGTFEPTVKGPEDVPRQGISGGRRAVDGPPGEQRRRTSRVPTLPPRRGRTGPDPVSRRTRVRSVTVHGARRPSDGASRPGTVGRERGAAAVGSREAGHHPGLPVAGTPMGSDVVISSLTMRWLRFGTRASRSYCIGALSARTIGSTGHGKRNREVLLNSRVKILG